MIKKIVFSLFLVASSFGMMHEKITYSYEYSNLQSQSHESKNKPEESAQEYIPRNSLVNRRTKIVDVLLACNLISMIVMEDFNVQFSNRNFDIVKAIPKILILLDDLSQKNCFLSVLFSLESNVRAVHQFISEMNSKFHSYVSNSIIKYMFVAWMVYEYENMNWMTFWMISFKISSLHLSDWGRVFKYYITFPSFMIIVVSNVCWFVFNNMSHWARSSIIFNKF